MSYTTRQELEQRYGADEMAQRESALSAGAIERAVADADALVDGYLASRYSLPLSATPPNLHQVACAIARYNLLGEAATERARDDYKDAIAWLRDVGAGRVLLDSAAPVPGNEPAVVVMYLTSDAVFKRSGRP